MRTSNITLQSPPFISRSERTNLTIGEVRLIYQAAGTGQGWVHPGRLPARIGENCRSLHLHAVDRWPCGCGRDNAAVPQAHRRELTRERSRQGAWLAAQTTAQVSATAPELLPRHAHSAVCLACRG